MDEVISFMLRIKRTKSALLATTLFIASLLFTLGITGLAARGGGGNKGQQANSQKGSRDTQRGAGSGNIAKDRQQNRQKADRTSQKAVVGKQRRPSAAKTSHKAVASKQSRKKVVGYSGKGNAGFNRPGKQKGPSSKVRIASPRIARRGESLHNWGTSYQVNPVYINQWHQPRNKGGNYYYDGFGYSSGFSYGYWAFGHPRYRHYSSPFFLFGLLFIYANRGVVYHQPHYTYYDSPDYNNGYGRDGNYLNRGKYSGQHKAFDDIENAWMDNNSNLISRHIDPRMRLAVYSDGRYSYSMTGQDYRGMTADAMRHTSTISFDNYKVAKRSDGAYIGYGKHQFYDVDNNYKVAFVSYTLIPRNGKWMLTAVGTSSHRLG